jgi:hypothetical protein
MNEAVNGLAQGYLPTPRASPSSLPGSPDLSILGPQPGDPSSLGESILPVPGLGRAFTRCLTSAQLGKPFGAPSIQLFLVASPGPFVTALGPTRMVPPLTLHPGHPAGPYCTIQTPGHGSRHFFKCTNLRPARKASLRATLCDSLRTPGHSLQHPGKCASLCPALTASSGHHGQSAAAATLGYSGAVTGQSR